MILIDSVLRVRPRAALFGVFAFLTSVDRVVANLISRIMMNAFFLGSMLMLSAIEEIEADELDGVWVYPTEQPGQTSLLIIKKENYEVYRINGADLRKGSKDLLLLRKGRVIGDEGIFFFPDEKNCYSPYFFVHRKGTDLLIIGRRSYFDFLKNSIFGPLVNLRCNTLEAWERGDQITRPSLKSRGLE